MAKFTGWPWLGGLMLSIIAPAVSAQTPPPQPPPLPQLRWSQAGPINFMHCVRVHEDTDPSAWYDNFLCSSIDLGMRWSQAGSIRGMDCTRVHEDADPYAWHDNYLCLPASSPYVFSWSQSGPLVGKYCVQVYEAFDPHAWHDNFLCIEQRWAR